MLSDDVTPLFKFLQHHTALRRKSKLQGPADQASCVLICLLLGSRFSPLLGGCSITGCTWRSQSKPHSCPTALHVPFVWPRMLFLIVAYNFQTQLSLPLESHTWPHLLPLGKMGCLLLVASPPACVHLSLDCHVLQDESRVLVSSLPSTLSSLRGAQGMNEVTRPLRPKGLFKTLSSTYISGPLRTKTVSPLEPPGCSVCVHYMLVFSFFQ